MAMTEDTPDILSGIFQTDEDLLTMKKDVFQWIAKFFKVTLNGLAQGFVTHQILADTPMDFSCILFRGGATLGAITLWVSNPEVSGGDIAYLFAPERRGDTMHGLFALVRDKNRSRVFWARIMGEPSRQDPSVSGDMAGECWDSFYAYLMVKSSQ